MGDDRPGMPDRGTQLDHVLRTRGVRSVYQPIVDLQTREVVGYEALARGPENSPLEYPSALFGAGRAEGRLFELDWEARFAAIEGARAAGFPSSLRLFVNIEPDSLTQATDEARLGRAVDQIRDMSVVAEFTERALIHRPVEVMDAVEWLRELGLGVAVDDVGADVGSLALMPFMHPDVIKLDMRIIQDRPDRDTVAVANAVQAEAELQGSTILAEGIETEGQVARAVAMGARMGQGWLFGRPGPLPERFDGATSTLGLLQQPPRAVDLTPFGVAERSLPIRQADPDVLGAMSRHLEGQAREIAGVPVVLACFQTADRFTEPVRVRYDELARRAPFVGVFGVGLGDEVAPPLNAATLATDDPLAREWVVTVVGPHFAAALVAREASSGSSRRFRFALTFRRELVLEIGRTLFRRLPRRWLTDA